MFRDRIDAGQQLGEALLGRDLRDPIVVGIPRGGVVIGAVVAEELGAELDVVLARKLRAAKQPEFAIGAISEDGEIFLNPSLRGLHVDSAYLQQECDIQMKEIARRKSLYRQEKPWAPVQGRSVILVDDGIATGSTMIAALHALRAENPHEIIVAVPVASPDRLEEIRPLCDDLVCLRTPENFYAIGQFYEDFSQVEDEEVLALLRKDGQPHHPLPTEVG